MPCGDRRWAQPPELGTALGEGRQRRAFARAAQGFWAKGTGSRNSMPALPRPGPTDRPSCLFRQPCRRECIPTRLRSRRADRGARPSRSMPSADVRVIGDFQAVTPPEIERDEDAFPGLPLESHSGTVKWVAPIQFAAGSAGGDRQDPGQSQDAIVRCQWVRAAEGLSFFGHVATRRAGGGRCGRRTAEGNAGFRAAKCPPPPSVRRQLSRRPIRPQPADRKRRSACPPAVASRCQPAETAKPRRRQGTAKSIGCRSPMPPNWGRWSARGFDVEQIRENVRKEDVGLGIVGAIFAGFLGGLILNIMPCVLPVIGLKILSFVEQSGHNRRKAFMLNVWYSAGLAGGLLCPGVAGRRAAAPGLGRVVRKGLVHDHADGRGVRHGPELHGRVGSAAAGVPGKRQGGRTGRAGGRRGGVLQRRIDHASGHAVQCPVPGPGPGLGHGTTGLADLCRVSFRGPGHGQSVSCWWAPFPNYCDSCPSPARGWRPSRSSWASC